MTALPATTRARAKCTTKTTSSKISDAADPDRDCPFCARLVAFRLRQRDAEPAWFNAPVPTFAGEDVEVLVIGLAPGLRGANRTGRPFTGDYAGDLLYQTLQDFGLARGCYRARPDDGLTLVRTAITNAVRCVPPENKPIGAEIATCRAFLERTIAGFPRLKALVALGRVAHDSTLAACGRRRSAHPFAHAAEHPLEDGLILFDSYHCSRYNTQTRRLTPDMFRAVFRRVAEHVGPD